MYHTHTQRTTRQRPILQGCRQPFDRLRTGRHLVDNENTKRLTRSLRSYMAWLRVANNFCRHFYRVNLPAHQLLFTWTESSSVRELSGVAVYPLLQRTNTLRYSLAPFRKTALCSPKCTHARERRSGRRLSVNGYYCRPVGRGRAGRNSWLTILAVLPRPKLLPT
jgi:hypothetical protein